MRRDVAKFREGPGRDEERGVIDWSFAHLPLRGPAVNVGFNTLEAHLSANFPTRSSEIKGMMVS